MKQLITATDFHLFLWTSSISALPQSDVIFRGEWWGSEKWAYAHKRENQREKAGPTFVLPVFSLQYGSDLNRAFKLWSQASEKLQYLLHYLFLYSLLFCLLYLLIYAVWTCLSQLHLNVAPFYDLSITSFFISYGCKAVWVCVLLYYCISNSGSRLPLQCLHPQFRADFHVCSHVFLQPDSQTGFSHESLMLFLLYSHRGAEQYHLFIFIP